MTMGNSSNRLIIRAGNRTLSFLKRNDDGTLVYLPYTIKSGMSLSANLRTAFREEEILAGDNQKFLLLVNSPTSLVPVDEYMNEENFDSSLVFDYTFTGKEHEEKISNVLPDLGAVAIFGVNKDLKLVVTDHSRDVRIMNVMQPVWEHLYKHSMLVQQRHKLYGYFHDGVLDVFAFQPRRFRYSNSFEVSHAHDAMYFLLYVWKQLAMDNEQDELHLIGDLPHKDWLFGKLRQFLRRVYPFNPVADLNRSEVSQIKNMNFDMMLCE